MFLKSIFKSVKEHFADHGIIGGTFIGLLLVMAFIAFFPFFLIEFLNDCSKRWFGGDPDA